MRYTKVSVVIPIYNVEKYLHRCIDSVIGQTYTNLDILLINDGSTDNCENICHEYEKKDFRIKYFYHDNIGLALTRNRGIRLATGEYITFLDSDDWFEPSFIEDLLVNMEGDNADIGLCDINYVDDNNGNAHIVKLRFMQRKVSVKQDKSVINKSRLFAWGKIYRKSLFTYFNLEFPDFAYEDICTPLLIAHANAISYIPKALINYVENRSDSLSNVSKNIGDMGKGLIWLKERLIKENLYNELMPEYKKIALAQLRFAARRFGIMTNQVVQADLVALANVVEELLPNLCGIAERKYYVPKDSPVLRLSLDRCLPYKNQIVDSPNEADSSLIIDEAVLKYNMAELIMEIM